MGKALSLADFSPAMQAALKRPKEATLDLERYDYEQSLRLFTQDAWKYVDPKPFVGGWHLDAIAEHLQAVTRGQIRNLLINIPPRMTKSLLVSVCWPAWVWAQRARDHVAGPQVQFLTTSYASPLSIRDSVRCRRLVSSPWYQRLWGRRFQPAGDQNAKQRFDNSAGGYRLATSVGGTLTGEGGDVIVVDDPHNTVEIESEAVIANTTMWWDEALSTRLNDPDHGAYVVIMQRLSEIDIAGHILNTEPENWTHLCLPMEYEPKRHCTTTLPWTDPRTVEGELLAPNRYSADSLTRLKKKLGPYGTAGQLQQNPVPRGGGIIKSHWWETWPPEGEQLDRQGRPLKTLSYPEMEFIIGSVDTAMTEKEENDFSAMTVWGVWYNQYDIPQVMLMEAWEERLEFHDLVTKIIGICNKRKLSRLLVEGKNTGYSVVQEIKRLCAGGGFQVFAEPVKGDKIARAHSVVPMFAAGQVWAPDRKWSQKVIDNCASFPKAQHDDLVDTVTQALSHMRKNSLLQMPDERRDQLKDRLKPVGEKRGKLPYDV
jgi:predicted phage terminase large subunit-like protein